MAKFWGHGKFPYTNINNLNLDWMIKLVLDLKDSVKELIIDVGNAYIKPETGIPKTDLSESVQSSLNLADSAIQSVPDTYRTAAEQDIIDAAQDAIVDTLFNGVEKTGALVRFNQRAKGFIKNILVYSASAISDAVIHVCGINFLKISGVSAVLNGVTFTVNEDGTIIANGTATGASAVFAVARDLYNYLPDGDYVLSGCPDGGNLQGYYLDFTRSPGAHFVDFGSGVSVSKNNEYELRNIRIVITQGTTVENIVFAPMLRLPEDSPAFVKFIGKDYHISVIQDVENTYKTINAQIVSVIGQNNIWSNRESITITVNDYITTLAEIVVNSAVKTMLCNVENDYVASKEYVPNDFVIVDDSVYKITAAIQIGGTLSDNVNIEKTTIGDVLKALLNGA
jgi:hypothetical protein